MPAPVAILCLLGAVVSVGGQHLAPAIIPQPPSPFHTWNYFPTAFHGANRSGLFDDDAVRLLARYQVSWLVAAVAENLGASW